jgi:hypothetical protein
MLLTSCSTPTRTPKILDYATRTASEVQIKLADGNGLTMDLTEPNVLYNGVVSVQLKGKKFPPVLCDPEAAQHFDEDIQRDGFFVRYRWGQPVSRDFTSVVMKIGFYWATACDGWRAVELIALMYITASM